MRLYRIGHRTGVSLVYSKRGTLTYDELNRLTGRAIPLRPGNRGSGENVVLRREDIWRNPTSAAVTASRGKATGLGTRASSMKYEYDAQGRISASEQKTPASAANADRFTYGYYANDGLASEGYPSGGW
jgi:hypothetical protein